MSLTKENNKLNNTSSNPQVEERCYGTIIVRMTSKQCIVWESSYCVVCIVFFVTLLVVLTLYSVRWCASVVHIHDLPCSCLTTDIVKTADVMVSVVYINSILFHNFHSAFCFRTCQYVIEDLVVNLSVWVSTFLTPVCTSMTNTVY